MSPYMVCVHSVGSASAGGSYPKISGPLGVCPDHPNLPWPGPPRAGAPAPPPQEASGACPSPAFPASALPRRNPAQGGDKSIDGPQTLPSPVCSSPHDEKYDSKTTIVDQSAGACVSTGVGRRGVEMKAGGSILPKSARAGGAAARVPNHGVISAVVEYGRCQNWTSRW